MEKFKSKIKRKEKLTKQEKDLVKKIEAVMERKKIEGNPSDFYSITKKSTNHYEGIVECGNVYAKVKGKDTKSTIKALTKSIS
jgi:hypothetical protein